MDELEKLFEQLRGFITKTQEKPEESTATDIDEGASLPDEATVNVSGDPVNDAPPEADATPATQQETPPEAPATVPDVDTIDSAQMLQESLKKMLTPIQKNNDMLAGMLATMEARLAGLENTYQSITVDSGAMDEEDIPDDMDDFNDLI